MEDEHVTAGRLEVFDVETRTGDTAQVLGERLPLVLPVGERLVSTHPLVVRAEQRPQIPARTRHSKPPGDHVEPLNLRVAGAL
ncbi:hypothetical protein [Streptomyces sp. NPDC056987]|uniref:hypothetical protein n=1 Tax=Streptomyces sp. NPDC056987 TaxID=3345988 RepID=UPI00362827B3